MLSYRHAFHTGNHADVLKHFIQYLVLNYYNLKDKPYWYIDTHSGAGLYDLNHSHTQKLGEYHTGIERLYTATHLPPQLNAFKNHIQQIINTNQYYCGSPWLAQTLLRQNDKLRLFELHPNDFRMLLNNFEQIQFKKRVIIKQEDGYTGLLSLLPPPPRRAVILIDPPYEQKQDYQKVTHTIQQALNKFAQGCYLIWYPCLSRHDSLQLPEKLQKIYPNNFLCAEIHVHAPNPNGFGMHGSGMFIINPPYLLTQQLQENLPVLVTLLAQDKSAHFKLNYHIS